MFKYSQITLQTIYFDNTYVIGYIIMNSRSTGQNERFSATRARFFPLTRLFKSNCFPTDARIFFFILAHADWPGVIVQ